MIVEDQSEVVAFLSRPDTWGLDDGAVERIETHGAIVFLAGDRAWKLKRAVRFPYLDFSTLERRRECCLAEVEINRRTAADLYRGVVAVVRRPDGSLALGGDGEPIDWLVEMVRFEQEALFDRLASTGRLDRFAMESLADTIARFHAEAERTPDGGGAEGIARVLDNNAQSFAQCPPGALDSGRIGDVETRTRAAFDRVAPLLERRRRDGLVRHCHGDLHLRNIVVHDGCAVLFDAIEFDPAFARIDVLYDIAFLVMDLQFRGLGGLASIVLNRYLDNTGDADGLAALPLFLAVRASIRSHIAAVAASAQSGAADAERLTHEARRYLDLAASFLRPEAPRLVAVGGLSGSGKSRLARQLAPCVGPAPGARVVRTDSTRKRLAGVALGQRLGSRDYSEEAGRRTYAAVLDEARAALASACSVIADAVFARPEERAAIAAVAAEEGVPFQGLWLDAPARLLEERVTGRRNNVSDATPEVVRMQLAYDLGDIDWIRLDTSDDADATLERALALLAIAPRQE